MKKPAAPRPYRTRRFVLRMSRAQGEVAAVARRHGWSYVGERLAGARKPHVMIMETALPGVSVWYWEFSDNRLCAVTVDSILGPEPIGPVATLLQAELVPFMLTELLEGIDSGSDPVLGLSRAGFGAPDEADPAFLYRFSAAARASDPAVRNAAIKAMTQTGWPQWGPVFEEIARTDDKPELREIAGRAIRVLPMMRPEGRPTPVSIPDLMSSHRAKVLHPTAMQLLAEATD